MPVQMHMSPMDRLWLTVAATIQRAFPGIPFREDGRPGTGVVPTFGRNTITVYLRDHDDATATAKSQLQQRFQDRVFAALAAELGERRVKRVSTVGGSKGVKVAMS